jgi:hypothetical protein
MPHAAVKGVADPQMQICAMWQFYSLIKKLRNVPFFKRKKNYSRKIENRKN